MNPDSNNASHHGGLNKVLSKLSTTEKGSSIVLLWALIVGSLTGCVGALFQIALAQIATAKDMFFKFLEVTPGLPLYISSDLYLCNLILPNTIYIPILAATFTCVT